MVKAYTPTRELHLSQICSSSAIASEVRLTMHVSHTQYSADPAPTRVEENLDLNNSAPGSSSCSITSDPRRGTWAKGMSMCHGSIPTPFAAN